MSGKAPKMARSKFPAQKVKFKSGRIRVELCCGGAKGQHKIILKSTNEPTGGAADLDEIAKRNKTAPAS